MAKKKCFLPVRDVEKKRIKPFVDKGKCPRCGKRLDGATGQKHFDAALALNDLDDQAAAAANGGN